MRKFLSEKFNIEVIYYTVSNIDYIRDTASLKISYHVNKKEVKNIKEEEDTVTVD